MLRAMIIMTQIIVYNFSTRKKETHLSRRLDVIKLRYNERVEESCSITVRSRAE